MPPKTRLHDPKAPAAKRAGRAAAPRAVQPEDESTKVPSGTTKEVLSWVGEDKERAQQALDVEQSHDEPRKGLVKELNLVLDD